MPAFKNIAFILGLFLPLLLCGFDLFDRYGLSLPLVSRVFSGNSSSYLIYVKKEKYKLFIINRKREVVKVFDVAVGRKENFQRKAYQGDNGTPEGLYFVNEVLSSAADPKSGPYQRLKYMNSVYFRAGEGHFLWGRPDQDAGTNVYGPRFFGINYPNDDDMKYYYEQARKGLIPRGPRGTIRGPGSGLAIHGTNDPVSIGRMISSGCVRLKNEDVVLLDEYIREGTPVYIER